MTSNYPGFDRDLFEEVALPYLDDVFRFALSLARNRARAEDLAQDTYLLAFRAFGRLRPGSNIKAWLFRICKNRFIDGFRRHKRRPQHDHTVEQVAAKTPNPETEIFERNGIENENTFLDLFGDEVNRYISELPEEYRSAVLLCDLEELRYDEISEILGVPTGTIRSRISRGRAILREKLEEYARDLGYGSESRERG